MIEIIRARSKKALNLAMKQLTGYNSQYVHRLEDRLIQVTALIEASIDFPEDVGEPDYQEIAGLLSEVRDELARLLAAGKRAEIYRSGAKVVICGKPNVGKSSLLNWLSGWERAIVTEIPGTTRDIIEEYVNIKGIPVRLIDTAGIRRTEDRVEAIGIKMAQQAISEAELAIFLLDITSGITEEDKEIYQSLNPAKTIIFINKDDLLEKQIDTAQIERLFPGIPVIVGSVREEKGLSELEDIVEAMLLAGQGEPGDLEMLLSTRQQQILQRCMEQIGPITEMLGLVSLDCLAVEINEVIEVMGELTGRSLKAEAMERIFRDFCIGK